MVWIICVCTKPISSGADCALDPTPQPVVESGFHRSVIRELIFSADGRQLVSVSDDKTIRVWSVEDSGRDVRLARVIRGPICAGCIGAIYAAALSPPDDRGRQEWLAAAGCLSDDPDLSGVIRIHDFAQGDIVALLRGHALVVNALAFHPQGRWLASGGKDGTLRIWDLQGVARGEPPTEAAWVGGHGAPVYDLAWSSDGGRLASASYDGTLGLWDTTGIDRRQVELIGKLSHDGTPVRSVAFHPEGRKLVSGDKKGRLSLWDAARGELTNRIQTGLKSIAALTFAPRGDRLICGNDDLFDTRERVGLFAFPSLQSQGVLTVHDNVVVATAIAPDGRTAASAGGDRKQIIVWDLASRKILWPVEREGGGGTLYAVGISHDGQALYWGWTPSFESYTRRGPLEHTFNLQGLNFFQYQTGRALQAQTEAGDIRLDPEMDPQTHYLDKLRVVSTQQGRQTQLATLTRDLNNGYQHSAYAIDKAGEHILSGGLNGTLELYTTTGALEARLTGHEGEIKAVAFSADGRWALSGGYDQTLRWWRLGIPARGAVRTIAPALSLLATTDGRWIAWTPQGYYACSPEGSHLIGHLINQGPGRLARYVSADQLFDGFYNPAVVWAGVHDAPEAKSVMDRARLSVPSVLAQEQPPGVRIIAPRPTVTVVDVATLPVSARVAPQTGEQVELEWRVNHRSVAVESIASSQEARTYQQNLPLAPGKNLIEVLTRTGLYKIESQPDRIEVNCTARAELKPRLCIVAVGINQYGQKRIKALTHAVSDAKDVLTRVAQIGRCQYDFYSLAPLLDQEATYANIKEAIARVGGILKSEDVFLLFLAGHGATLADRFHFFTHDTQVMDSGESKNTVTQEDLRQWLLNLKAGKTLVLIDACQSGGIQLWPLRSLVDQTAVNKLGRRISRNLIVSAGFDQMALEGYNDHGVFTYALLEALLKTGCSPTANGWLQIKVTGVAGYVEELVPKITREVFQKEQTPYHHLIGTDFSIGMVSPSQ